MKYAGTRSDSALPFFVRSESKKCIYITFTIYCLKQQHGMGAYAVFQLTCLACYVLQSVRGHCANGF